MFESYRNHNRYRIIKDVELEDNSPYVTSTLFNRSPCRIRTLLSILCICIGSSLAVIVYSRYNHHDISLLRNVNNNEMSVNNPKSKNVLPTAWSWNWRWDHYPDNICIPGTFRSVSQLPHDRITFKVKGYTGFVNLDLSMYFTHNFDVPAVTNKQLYNIKSAIIIQHGNLRNGNDYFCGVINSLLLSKSSTELERFIVIAPQFFSDGDICWWKNKNVYSTINSQDSSTWCDLQIYSSDGWKDGHNSLNAGSTFYSYDVYNLLMERLLDSTFFPNLEDITLFGFSAGAQVLMRYAAYPLYAVPPDRRGKVKVRYVISDPSTFLYFDRRRPVNDENSDYNYRTVADENRKIFSSDTDDATELDIITCSEDESSRSSSSNKCDLNYDNPNIIYNPQSDMLKPQAFAIPNQSWMRDDWMTDSDGFPWITDWKLQCSNYNDWRYGLENFVGYFKFHSQINENFMNDVITGFKNRNIIFLAGTSDTSNCHLDGFEGCQDNELATYCEAMLQGNNRLDRIIKWKAYLHNIYIGYTPRHSPTTTSSDSSSSFSGSSSSSSSSSSSVGSGSSSSGSSSNSGNSYKDAEPGEKVGINKVIDVATMHPLIFSTGVEHDPVQMVFSHVGRCVIFNLCEPL